MLERSWRRDHRFRNGLRHGIWGQRALCVLVPPGGSRLGRFNLRFRFNGSCIEIEQRGLRIEAATFAGVVSANLSRDLPTPVL
jgi:hypothetical protein